MGLISSVVNYAKRAWKITPEFLLGDSAEIAGKAMNKQKGSIFKKVKAGVHALENDTAKKAIKEGGFAKRVFKNLVNTPGTIKNSVKAGARAAKMAGKSAFLGGTKGLLRGIGKKMPFIGAALTVLFEVPNLYTAFSEGGFGAGMKEVGGAAVELGCMAAGAAIGSAICPGIGTVIGGIVGAIGGSLLRGKTYSDKKAEAEAQAQLPQYTEDDIAALKEYGFSDEEIEQLRQNGYSMEDISKAIAEDQAAMQEKDNQESVAPSDNTRVVKPAVENAPSQIQELKAEIEALEKQLQQYTQTPYSSYNPFSYSMPYMNNFNSQFGYNNLYSNPFISSGVGYNNFNPSISQGFGCGNIYSGLNQGHIFKYTG